MYNNVFQALSVKKLSLLYVAGIIAFEIDAMNQDSRLESQSHAIIKKKNYQKRPRSLRIDCLESRRQGIVDAEMEVRHAVQNMQEHMVKRALYNNKLEVLRKILNAHNSRLRLTQDAHAQEGETLLHYACRIKNNAGVVEYPNEQIIRLLFDKGAGHQSAGKKPCYYQQILF